MASMNIANTERRWGSSSYNSSTDIKVGKTGSSSSDGTKYRGRIRFPPLDKTMVISSIKLVLNRIDSYNAHTLQFGSSSSGAWGTARDWTKNFSISKGTGNKTLNLTEFVPFIQSYAGNWYIHILHGSGTNSYSEFKGSSSTPYLVVDYEFATVNYRNDSTWQKCLVYYYNNGEWIQCVPWYNSGGTWIQA